MFFQFCWYIISGLQIRKLRIMIYFLKKDTLKMLKSFYLIHFKNGKNEYNIYDY